MAFEALRDFIDIVVEAQANMRVSFPNASIGNPKPCSDAHLGGLRASFDSLAAKNERAARSLRMT